MKKRVASLSKALLLFALLCLLATQQSAVAQQTDKASQIDELMKTYQSYRQFNGSVLVAEGGKVILKKGYGLANMEWNIANEPDTKFRIGSLTKQFTSMLILQLAQEGKVKLDAHVTDYLPDYRKDTGSRITIHQLLNHTSGIPSYTNRPDFREFSLNSMSTAEFVKRYASGALEFEPGAKFNYNNSGYFILGAIIERVTGKPYEQVLRERILDPVGMKSTGYDHFGVVIPKRAAGYEKSPAGYVNAAYLDMSAAYAAGALYSTVEDLHLWDQALYADKLLAPEFKELLFKPGLNDYAYGWYVTDAPLAPGKSLRIVLHEGAINGFNTIIVRFPENRDLIVLLNNTGNARFEEMTRNIALILAGMPAATPRQPVADALARTLATQDAQAAVKQYRELKATQADAYDFGEGELNALGYQLIGTKRVKDAIEIFKLNVEMYPQSFNTYDSLAEAYALSGDKELAIQNYKKSLALNPQNTNAVEALKKLESK
jgi:CubicO group peptidase (beta-lactamase class C family)